MRFRESLSGNPGRVVAVVAIVLIAVAALMIFRGRGPASASIAEATTSAFFSIDDGKTWFSDDAKKIPPFDKDGKPAVRAYVFRTGSGTSFVNHLERFIPQAKKALEDAQKPVDPNSRPMPGQSSGVQGAYMGGREIKRPGDAKWISAGNYKEASKITAIKAPNGGTDATPVEP